MLLTSHGQISCIYPTIVFGLLIFDVCTLGLALTLVKEKVESGKYFHCITRLLECTSRGPLSLFHKVSHKGRSLCTCDGRTDKTMDVRVFYML